MLFLALHWARKLSWQETALSFCSTCWDKVCQSVEYVVQWGCLEHRQLGPIVAIGVDEIQYGDGHKYLTGLVYQIEQQCTRLAMDRPRADYMESFDW